MKSFATKACYGIGPQFDPMLEEKKKLDLWRSATTRCGNVGCTDRGFGMSAQGFQQQQLSTLMGI